MFLVGDEKLERHPSWRGCVIKDCQWFAWRKDCVLLSSRKCTVTVTVTVVSLSVMQVVLHACPHLSGCGRGGMQNWPKNAPNAIFRVASCIHTIWHHIFSLVGKFHPQPQIRLTVASWCFLLVMMMTDLVTHSSPLMIEVRWCYIPLPSDALCQTTCPIPIILSHLNSFIHQSM